MKVCSDLNRRCITGDVSPVAIRVIIDRLKDNGHKFKVLNPPLTRIEWKNISDSDFEKKICMFMGWIHNPSSKPIDGWTDKTKQIPVEIKNHTNSITRSQIAKFVGDMNGLKKGVFVGWEFSKGAWEYVHQVERDQGKKIELIPAHTIIGDLVLNQSQREKYQKLYEERVKEQKQRQVLLKSA